MQVAVGAHYEALSEATGAEVVDVGDAWRRIRRRAPGLDPSYFATTTTRRGHFVSFTVEWRRERLEITGSLSSRPEYETDESLIPFGEISGSLATTAVARTPRAMLRFRIIS